MQMTLFVYDLALVKEYEEMFFVNDDTNGLTISLLVESSDPRLTDGSLRLSRASARGHVRMSSLAPLPKVPVVPGSQQFPSVPRLSESESGPGTHMFCLVFCSHICGCSLYGTASHTKHAGPWESLARSAQTPRIKVSPRQISTPQFFIYQFTNPSREPKRLQCRHRYSSL